MSRVLYLSVFLVLAFTSGGCGSGDDDSADEATTTSEVAESTTTEPPNGGTAEEYTAALVKNLTGGALGLAVPRELAECLAPEFVEIITVETLVANDVTLGEAASASFDYSELGLDDSQGTAMAAAFAPCGEDPADFTARYMRDDLTEAQIQCAADNLDAAKIEALWAKSIVSTLDDGEFDSVIQPAVEACDLPAT